MSRKRKKNTSKISITLPIDLLKKIDKARGMIPRSPFMAKKMKKIRWDK